MKTKVRKIDLHPEEFLAGISGEMSPSELGVYWMICLLCYTRGGMIKYDTEWLCQKFRVGKGNRVIPGIVEKLIANGKVVRDGSEIGVRRALDELEIVLRRIRDSSENGAKGNKIRWGADRKCEDEKIAINNHQPTTSKRARAREAPLHNGEVDDEPEFEIGERSAPPPRRSRRIPPTRLDPDWQPDDEDRQYARDQGLGERRIEIEIQRFKNYAVEHDWHKSNWKATWRNWVIKSIEIQAPQTERPLEEWERMGMGSPGFG